MVQGSKSKIAVIGGGPAGCFCSFCLQNDFDVTVFESKKPLATLLPTGGGRCNLAYSEYDFKELASNYPRGEKFLYSVFSKFAVSQTLEFFKNIGVETYVQEDLRVFPVSDSAADVRDKFLKSLSKIKFINEKVLRVDEKASGFTIKTDGGKYVFDKVVIAVGGHAGYFIAQNLGHNIIPPKPSLAGLETSEDFSILSGVCIKGVKAMFDSKSLTGDIMFTHHGITGPLIYKISSIKARDNFPYYIYINFADEIDLQNLLNSNPKKNIKNLLSELVPKSFAEFLLSGSGINYDIECNKINGAMRDKILLRLQKFEIKVEKTVRAGEIVTSGGVDLKEINSKTMESKLVKGLYFCGEVLDIDGFCGGFNLQNCWSTGYTAACGVKETAGLK